VVRVRVRLLDCMEELRTEAPVDLLACDMNMCEALQAIEVMLPLAPLLRKGGYIVMTWKLPKYDTRHPTLDTHTDTQR